MIERFFRCLDNPGALLAIIITAMTAFGLVVVYSASGALAGLQNHRSSQAISSPEEFTPHHDAGFLKKQSVWALAGIVALLLVVRVPIETIEKIAPWLLLGSMVLLLAVIATPLGVEAKGARRWLRLGPITIQPAEFAKIGLIVYMARFLADRREQIKEFKRGFVPSVLIMGVFSVLVMLEKDLGTIVLVGTVVLSMWCLSRMKMWHIGTAALAALPVLVFLVFQHSYRIHRILAFFDPEKYAMTYAYQLNQSLIAVGSGGIFGVGLGEGLQKYHFLSESHTDFVFAILCEETGFIGAISVVLLFLAYVLAGFRISYKAPDYFAGLAAAGLTLTIGCAAFINFFVVLGMAPTKGLALPFFTYGGSSLIAGFLITGLLINISNYTLRHQGQKEAF